jgi:hypothetical protein
MANLNYNWIPKGFDIVDTEDFLFIRYRNVPKEVYLSTNPRLSEEFFKKRIGRLERELQGEIK